MRKRILIGCLIPTLLASCASTSPAAPTSTTPINISGDWTGANVETGMYMQYISMHIEQAQDKITGTMWFSDSMQNRPKNAGTLNGTVNGDQISMTATFDKADPMTGMLAMCKATISGFSETRNDTLQFKLKFASGCGDFWSSRTWPALFLARQTAP